MAGRCGERRYADHIFFQIYFRMHHFVVNFSKFSSPQAARGALTPLTKILRAFLPSSRAATEKHCDSATTDDFAQLHDIH